MEQDRPCAEEPNDPRELDCMYKEADRVYYLFARDCGLSTCAYWMLYDVERAGGTVEMRELSDSWAYSKQTINSAIKAMEAKGLIELGFVEGSRRNKTVSLTGAGEAFADRYIRPAQQAERRAFCSLTPRERRALLDHARAYTNALVEEMNRIRATAAERNGKGEDA